jgi:ppGpp synthetase/RelA/SpoT-type nucleotidyltranferase
MAWAVPLYTRSVVNRAGDTVARWGSMPPGDDMFADYSEWRKYESSIEVINNWRSSHQYPLNTFQMTLRRKSRLIASSSIVSQRLKRMESIERKLCSGTITLTQMQDIGGCRAVLPTLGDAYKLCELYKSARFDHQFKNEKDYIKNPKEDGYRSIHLIYKYKGTNSSDAYNNLQIEIQIRSQLQHAWATAVEAVSIFTKQALKWRGGTAEWQKFFLVMSNAIAKMESPDAVTATAREIGEEVRYLSNLLSVQNVLRAYRVTLNYVGTLEERKAKLMLVRVDPDQDSVQVQGFRIAESQQANAAYAVAEKAIPDGSSSQAVLVRVESIDALRRAYPNYFLDTELFTQIVDQVVSW